MTIDFLSAIHAGMSLEPSPNFIVRYERTIEEIAETISQSGGMVDAPTKERVLCAAATTLDAGSNPASDTKPCCARLRFPSGNSGWCGLADGHSGDHVALGVTELPSMDFGPRAATNTRRGKL